MFLHIEESQAHPGTGMMSSLHLKDLGLSTAQESKNSNIGHKENVIFCQEGKRIWSV